MQFLKTAFWVILAVAIALFSKANWDIQASNIGGRIPIKLWDDWILLVRLPVLIVTAFLLGLLPMWIFARISRWAIRRRLQNAEQALAATTSSASVAVVTLPVGVEPLSPAPPIPAISPGGEEVRP